MVKACLVGWPLWNDLFSVEDMRYIENKLIKNRIFCHFLFADNQGPFQEPQLGDWGWQVHRQDSLWHEGVHEHHCHLRARGEIKQLKTSAHKKNSIYLFPFCSLMFIAKHFVPANLLYK